MARTLKTYITSIGFYDVAVAAPSMKAALEAWGAGSNLFHQGFAQETTDRAITSAAMAKPGVVLKRPVGSRAAFTERAELPRTLADPKSAAARTGAKARPKARRRTTQDPEEARKATQAFARQQERRERERRQEEAVRQRQQAKRERAVAKAEAALETARSNHERKIARFDQAIAALEKQRDDERSRWARQQKDLKERLR